MRLSSILLGGAATFALSTAGFAADLIIEQPPIVTPVPMTATDWSGFYIGGNIGYGAGTLEVTNLPIDEQDVDGAFGGIQFGYNMQFDDIVFGLQSDFQLSGVEGEEDPADSIDTFGSTTVRLGLALDNLLPYVKGGLAYATGTGYDDDLEDSAYSAGWTLGLGVEMAVVDNISVFAEYDYYNFGEAEFDFGGQDVDVETTLHAVKAGVNFGF